MSLVKSFLLAAASLTLAPAFATPGTSALICKSSAAHGHKQSVLVKIARANIDGVAPPSIEITVNGKRFVMPTPDATKLYGRTLHDAALGVITATADNQWDANAKTTMALQLLAMPSTVKAYDQEGRRTVWSLQKDDGGTCSDGSGRAIFKGILTGNLTDGSESTHEPITIDLDAQILNCTLIYDTGSAC